MIRLLALLLSLLPAATMAEAPAVALPRNLTPQAELSFALAALGLVLALGAVHWLVARR